MKIPDWAIYIATNADGTVYAFSGEAGIFIIDGGIYKESEEVWEPIDDNDYYQFIEQQYPDLFWRESIRKIK